jgi:hypothetical protein
MVEQVVAGEGVSTKRAPQHMLQMLLGVTDEFFYV